MTIGRAIYYIVMFQVDPVPMGAPGPIRLRVTKDEYNVACSDARATIICPKGKFMINSKRAFANEIENSVYLVADVIKVIE